MNYGKRKETNVSFPLPIYYIHLHPGVYIDATQYYRYCCIVIVTMGSILKMVVESYDKLIID